MTVLTFRKNSSLVNYTWEFLVSLTHHCLTCPDFCFYQEKIKLGFFSWLGPIIKAEVGEQIVITFKNKASRPYSITAHGVKASGAHIPVRPGENVDTVGRFYQQKPSAVALTVVVDVFLSLGNIIELTWDVPESSGPGISDPNCISYIYYSNVDFIKVPTVLL